MAWLRSAPPPSPPSTLSVKSPAVQAIHMHATPGSTHVASPSGRDCKHPWYPRVPPYCAQQGRGGSHAMGVISDTTDRSGSHASCSSRVGGDDGTSRTPPERTHTDTTAQCASVGMGGAGVTTIVTWRQTHSSSFLESSFLTGHLEAQWSPTTPHLPHLYVAGGPLPPPPPLEEAIA